jgi:3-hydroxyisobutyrate dehydrogenase-like beta-hydroxyacid dehydrogenase
MATRLMAAGHAVFGTARRRDDAQALIDQGLRCCGSARDIAALLSVLDAGAREAR